MSKEHFQMQHYDKIVDFVNDYLEKHVGTLTYRNKQFH